jgi:hypothetical protein
MAEEKEGKKIVAVAMEVNGCLTINPIFDKEKKAEESPDKAASALDHNSHQEDAIAIE